MPVSFDDLVFDSYLDLIPVEADRRLLEEAGKAAQAGALRLAFVGVWLGCAESLKRRFQELAPLDSAAGAISGDISRKEAAQQAIDAFVLGKAKDYGFLSDVEHSRLEHIYQMRCVYGHPYEAVPSPEDLLSAASTVTDLVLSRPVKLRHGYIQRQVELLTSDATFLDDVEEAVARYAAVVFPRVDGTLHRYCLQKLWDAAQSLAGHPTLALFDRRTIWFSRAYLEAEATGILAGWDMIEVLSTHRDVATRVLAYPGAFALLSEHAQDIIVGNLVEFSAARPSCLKALEVLVSAGVTTERQEERFDQAVKGSSWEALAASGVVLSEWADQILAGLKSYNWYMQNPAADALWNAGPEGLGSLDEIRQRELGRNVLQAADGQARSAGGFLQQLSETASSWPTAFVVGVVLECFANDQDQVRFKPKCAQTALSALRKLTPRKRSQVTEAIAQVLNAGVLKRPEWAHEEPRQKMLLALDAQIAAEPALSAELQVIRDLVAALEIPDYE